MTRHRLLPWLVAILAAGPLGVDVGATPSPQPQGAPVTAEELRAAIDSLGRLDHGVRMNASRTIRRATPPQAVLALTEAATGHADGYVRYRALVLLSGFNNPRARDVMEQALTDPNDRLRSVAYTYFEHNTDATVVPLLLEALKREQSEFVRPQLTRALAAYGADQSVRAALLPLVDRGVDFFRSGVIEALGDYRASWAIDALDRVAGFEGPLQDDAVLALGKIGDQRSLARLAELQRTATREHQPALAAAICLLGQNCGSHLPFIEATLAFGIRQIGYQTLVRAAATALAVLAAAGRPEAAAALFDHGVDARDPARSPMALAAGTVAIRNPALMLGVLESRTDLEGAVLLLRDAFDMLEEDFEEERFFATVRRSYWAAPEGSPGRRVAEMLIQRLEF